MTPQEHDAVMQTNALLAAVGMPTYTELHKNRMRLLVASRGFLAAAGGSLPAWMGQAAQELRNATEES